MAAAAVPYDEGGTVAISWLCEELYGILVDTVAEGLAQQNLGAVGEEIEAVFKFYQPFVMATSLGHDAWAEGACALVMDKGIGLFLPLGLTTNLDPLLKQRRRGIQTVQGEVGGAK